MANGKITRYCLKCGAENNGDSGFCTACGAPFVAPQAVQQTVPPVQTAPGVQTVPPVQTAPGVQTVPPVQTAPGMQTVPPVQTPAAKPKKKAPILIILGVVVFLITFIAVSCLEKNDVVGVWTGSYTYNGNSYTVSISLKENGDYAKLMYKNGYYYSFETGDYEVSGNSIRLYDSSALTYHGVSTKYSYFFGRIQNNGHYLDRAD